MSIGDKHSLTQSGPPHPLRVQTIGLAPEDYFKGMLAREVDDLTFSLAAVSVYQLGNYGVAAEKLKSWALQ